MIENDVLRWGLMALLLGASLYAAFRAGRQSPPAIRAGYGLHAAMMIAMVPMLVPGLQWPALPQIVFFALAAWWFILRAVSRRPVQVAGLQVPAAGPGHGRGALLYNALTMAAMACMLAVMDLHGAGGTLAGPEASGLPGQTPHHGGPAVGLSLPGVLAGSAQDWSTQPALVLAPAFGLAAAVWGLLLFRRLSVPGRPRSGDAFLELVSAASMAVMFAALAV